jgi:hypothetical protein
LVRVVNKSISKTRIIISDSSDDEPNRNIQSPPPQKKDVGSSKTKVHFDAFMAAYERLDLSHFKLLI